MSVEEIHAIEMNSRALERLLLSITTIRKNMTRPTIGPVSEIIQSNMGTTTENEDTPVYAPAISIVLIRCELPNAKKPHRPNASGTHYHLVVCCSFKYSVR